MKNISPLYDSFQRSACSHAKPDASSLLPLRQIALITRGLYVCGRQANICYCFLCRRMTKQTNTPVSSLVLFQGGWHLEIHMLSFCLDSNWRTLDYSRSSMLCTISGKSKVGWHLFSVALEKRTSECRLIILAEIIRPLNLSLVLRSCRRNSVVLQRHRF